MSLLLLLQTDAGGSPPPTEQLGSGDLTTELAIWLRTVEQADHNTGIKVRLSAQYSFDDVTALLAHFLRVRG